MESKEIKAETWITVHYPFQKEWIVWQKGIFSRNYSGDLRSCDPEKQTLELSRNGLYEILPNTLFFTGRELLGKDQEDTKWIERVLKQRLEKIKTVMLPFDSSYFNHSLALENKLNETLADKNAIVLKEFFGNDYANEPNVYIRKMVPMIAQAATLRGNYRLLCKIISLMLGYKTDFKMIRYRVRFIVNRPGLNRNAFLKYLDELKPFFQFVEEWFIPFELQCEFKVKDYTRDDRFEGNTKMLLDYNATLGNKPHKTLNDNEQGY